MAALSVSSFSASIKSVSSHIESSSLGDDPRFIRICLREVSVEHKQSLLDALECSTSGGRRLAAMDCSALTSEHIVPVFSS